MGLSVAPLVGMAAARDLAARDSSTDALLPALGVAATGAGVVALVLGQVYHFDGYQRLWKVTLYDAPGDAALQFVVGVGLPAIALFLLGDGLRGVRHGPD